MKTLKHGVANTLSMVIATLFLLANVTVVALGQGETGQITGRVTDPQDRVVPGATVTAKSVTTGLERTATADDQGTYLITNLQPGLYDITVKGAGFAENTQRLQITVGAKLSLENRLSTESVQAKVDVVAGGVAEINITDQQLSTVVTTKQITELPTLTRNPYDLVSLSGNASDADPTGSTIRGAGFAINGQRSASTDILLDGAENVDIFVAGIGQSTPLDSVGEFRVITGDFSAEYGRATGGIVNAITKSGTNEFHGTAYEFNRISRLAANTPENNSRGNKKGVFARNQFGYSIGGPVLKNKLLFFNSTEWTKVRSAETQTAWVPTTAFINASNVRTRDFFAAYGKLASNVRLTGQTFGTNPAVAGPLFQQVSFSTPADAGGGLPQDTYQTVSRVDWNWTDKTQIYGRYAIESNKFTPGNYDFSPYEGFTIGTSAFKQNALVALTHQFGNNFISQTRLSYNRISSTNSVGADPNTPTLSGNFASPGGLGVYFPGFLSLFPGVGLPTSGAQNVGQIGEDLSYGRGSHNLKFGGQYLYIQDNELFPAFQNASQVLGANQNQIVANFLAGNQAQFQGAINPQGKFPGEFVTLPVSPPDFSRSNRYHEFAFYFNDSWRVTPRLTLSLGARYEYYGVQHNKNPEVESNFFLGSGATLQEQVANGVVKTSPNSGGLWKPDKNNIAPRVGFALDVFGDGTTSLRGGYGIAYERNFGNVTFNVIQNPPNYSVLAITPADLGPGATLPIFTNSAGPLAGTTPPTKQIGRVSLRAVDPNIVNAYSHLWSLSAERQVARDTIASVAYSGSAGRNLYSIANLNRLNSALRFFGKLTTCPQFGAAADSSRLNCQYTDINFRGGFAYSDYHGVTASLDSNNLFGLGLTMTNRYTYSVAKDNLSSTFTDGYQGNNGYRLGFTDPYQPDLDYGYADFDIRHRFTSSYIWQVPTPKALNNSLGRNLAGNWTLTGRVNLNSGAPFTVFDCTNTFRANTCPRLEVAGPINYGRPARLIGTGNPNDFVYTDVTGQTLIGDYADPYPTGAFGTDSGPYPAGMSARNAFRGPGFWQVDVGLYKGINLTEKYKLQLRGEFFNVFNHPNLGINGATTDIEFGNVTASKFGHRNVQLALKFIF
jgi:hypothetical protein